MKKILLPQGKYAIVDDEDFERVNQFKWHLAVKSTYAATWIKRKKILLHIFIMNPPIGMEVDHKNGDTLDNRKKNLRICTKKQNVTNQDIHKNNTSGYKGVSLYKLTNKWRAYICPNGKFISLGHFEDKRSAAKAYNKAAIKYFGEYAFLNQI